jgi:imidazoleglycerol phosphate synthase cyclase subunit
LLTLRIIPCLDVKNGRVVKGIKFQGLRDAGCPVELSKNYEAQGADELVFLDVSATPEGRNTHAVTVKKIREVLSIPLTTGGGVREVADARRLLEAGADKVSVNTAAVENPDLINQLAEQFGRQCTILALDAAKVEGQENTWEVVTLSGKNRTGKCAIEWAIEATQRGAGEILLTSWDRDGTRSGYDLDLLNAVSSNVSVPVIASGGADSPEHLLEALEAGADAVLAASIFHDGDFTVKELKTYLREKGASVRL